MGKVVVPEIVYDADQLLVLGQFAVCPLGQHINLRLQGSFLLLGAAVVHLGVPNCAVCGGQFSVQFPNLGVMLGI